MTPLPTLHETIETCLGNAEFMSEYKRLTGHRLGGGPPIDRMVDEATGKLDAEAKQFFDFVREYVWLPVVTGAA